MLAFDVPKAIWGTSMLLLPANLSDLIHVEADGSVSSREGKRLEFKEGFILSDLSDYTKVLASFANANGGVIIFGISNKPRTIVGANDMADEADWANSLRADFDPEIPFAIREYKAGAQKLYAVGVDASAYKPVICKKSRSKVITDKKGLKKDVMMVQEGSIYFRYAGQSRSINFPELHNMLVAREALYHRKMMETMQIVQKVGLGNAGVVDLSVPRSTIYMSTETAKNLNFIKKGKLVEEKGEPAYVVMGNVEIKDVVHAQLDEADKNIPTEAARLLSPIVAEVYGIPKIHPPQVKLILKHLGIHDDNQHCIVEKKFGRKFVTRAGLKAVEDFIRLDPTAAIRVFGSRAAQARHSMRNAKAKIEDMRAMSEISVEVLTTKE